ncbi:hypothetical protein OG401_00880 [Kitasatospora purpeofusca]|uniref:hypothetical protein n=1 Tax=Kitasatospora purpeofusca TaxID=67352 RepID=UPI002253069D|nr:hypothetical protein [Kitasatospora purpeofusca]MCX4682875.1 hypothetical protein [Kitasatospora purpeofusca]
MSWTAGSTPPLRYCSPASTPSSVLSPFNAACPSATRSRIRLTPAWSCCCFSLKPLYVSIDASASSFSASTRALTASSRRWPAGWRATGNRSSTWRSRPRCSPRKPPEPYERLLNDALTGDRSLFTRQDVVEETWRVIQPLVDHPPAPVPYKRGSWGPAHDRGRTTWQSPWLSSPHDLGQRAGPPCRRHSPRRARGRHATGLRGAAARRSTERQPRTKVWRPLPS